MTPQSSDLRGYGFAWFRKHTAGFEENYGNWYPPDFANGSRESSLCACGAGFLVGGGSHFHTVEGVCHAAEKCA